VRTTLLTLLTLLPTLLGLAACSDSFDDKGGDPDADGTVVGAAPDVSITAPTGDGPYYSDQPIALSAVVSDAEDAATALELRWLTEDGELDADSSVDDDGVVEGSVSLAEGSWTLELHAIDRDGNRAEDTVSLTVGGPNSAPTCAITSPTDGGAASEGAEVTFTGTASDADVPATSLSATWTSDLDGDLRSGAPETDGTLAFATRDLTLGTHRIQLQVTDEAGALCGESLFFTVGSPPTLTLDTPADGDRVNEGEAVVFTGSVGDAEDRAEDLSLSWQSSLDGEFSTAGADTSGALSLSTSDLQPGEHALEIRVTDTDGLYAVDQRTLHVNAVPTAPTVSISPDPAVTTDDLVATATGATDPDASGAVTLAYAWTEDGAALSETSATLPAASTTKGRTYRVSVTPSDDMGAGEAGTAELEVSNADPSLTGPSLSASTAQVGDTLICAATASDVDPADSPTVSMAWHDGSTGPTYTVVEGDDPGDTLSCTARADDGDGGTASGTATATVSNTDPSISAASVTPSTARVGDTLTCAATATDADGGSPTLTMTWPDGSTGSTYVVQASDDPGDVLTCSISASDTDGGSATTTATATVLNTDPVVGTVVISPSSATNDDTVSCTAAATDGDGGTPSLTYAWSGSIAGALGSGASLDLSTTAVGSAEVVTCTATATDTDGGTDTGTDTLTTDNRAPTVSLALTPVSPGADDTLTCSASTSDDDDDTLTTSFTWTVGGSAVSASSTSALVSTLEGAFVRGQGVVCSATTSDGKGGTDSDSDSTTIVNSAPSLSGVGLLTAVIRTDDVISATATTSDADGDSVTLSYAWTVSGTVVQTGASATLDGASGTVGFDRYDTVSVSVTASDSSTSTTVSSGLTTVSNTAPTTPSVSITPTDPEEGDALLCSVDTASTDADGDTVVYTLTWEADGSAYSAGSGWVGPSTATITDDTVDADDTLEDETWVCTVTPDDSTDAGTAATASVSIDMAIVSGDVSLTSASGIDFVSIEAGDFDMGCTPAQVATGDCQSNESPVQAVTLTHDFWMAQEETSQADFQAVLGYNPSWFPSAAVSSCTSQCPVDTVNWHEGAAMANAMSFAEGLTECYSCSGSGTSVSCLEATDPYTCEGYRLPTEAEWEYAARAGTDLVYSGSDDIDDVAWWNRTGTSYYTTRAGGNKLPNDWNLYDMSGNVMEWTHDARITYSVLTVTDPNGGSGPTCHALRGGSAGHPPSSYMRVSNRTNCGNTVRHTTSGFRLARTIR
jgi:large repetitive protein